MRAMRGFLKGLTTVFNATRTTGHEPRRHLRLDRVLLFGSQRFLLLGAYRGDRGVDRPHDMFVRGIQEGQSRCRQGEGSTSNRPDEAGTRCRADGRRSPEGFARKYQAQAAHGRQPDLRNSPVVEAIVWTQDDHFRNLPGVNYREATSRPRSDVPRNHAADRWRKGRFYPCSMSASTAKSCPFAVFFRRNQWYACQVGAIGLD